MASKANEIDANSAEIIMQRLHELESTVDTSYPSLKWIDYLDKLTAAVLSQPAQSLQVPLHWMYDAMASIFMNLAGRGKIQLNPNYQILFSSAKILIAE